MKAFWEALRPGRKNRYAAFDGGRNLPQAILLAALFFLGLWLSARYGGWGAALYIVLWIVSYPVIYAGTCRYCAYYGKKCPIPLEGAWVHRFFPPAGKPFGPGQLFWALAAYVLRILVPVAAVITHGAYFSGLIFALLFIAFWVIHLRIAGCPNCINDACPMNPDHVSRM